MKKTLVALAVAAVVLSGCGDSDSGTETTAPDVESPVLETEDPGAEPTDEASEDASAEFDDQIEVTLSPLVVDDMGFVRLPVTINNVSGEFQPWVTIGVECDGIESELNAVDVEVDEEKSTEYLSEDWGDLPEGTECSVTGVLL